MKRIPIILAGLVATLLAICFLEYGFRGLNPDVESDWVLHPGWWQSDFLADGGFYLWGSAVLALSPIERLFSGNDQAFFIVLLLLQMLIIVAVSFLVFYGVKLLLRIPSLTTRSDESSQRAGG
ncbi:MAG TPA: hypothetical protein VK961_01415 [Chthoniobacter sp.]|nr:hypothetical protein [Chthoniobacter sp.]